MTRAVQTRLSNKEIKNTPDEDDVMLPFSQWKPSYTPLQLQKKHSEDENLQVVVKWLQTKVRHSYEEIIKDNLVIRNYWHLWNSLFLENSILYRKFEKTNGSGEYKQFIVPQRLKTEAIFHLHSDLLSKHFGQKKTLGKHRNIFTGMG